MRSAGYDKIRARGTARNTERAVVQEMQGVIVYDIVIDKQARVRTGHDRVKTVPDR